jgi:hypothetical protein
MRHRAPSSIWPALDLSAAGVGEGPTQW